VEVDLSTLSTRSLMVWEWARSGSWKWTGSGWSGGGVAGSDGVVMLIQGAGDDVGVFLLGHVIRQLEDGR